MAVQGHPQVGGYWLWLESTKGNRHRIQKNYQVEHTTNFGWIVQQKDKGGKQVDRKAYLLREGQEEPRVSVHLPHTFGLQSVPSYSWRGGSLWRPKSRRIRESEAIYRGVWKDSHLRVPHRPEN